MNTTTDNAQEQTALSSATQGLREALEFECTDAVDYGDGRLNVTRIREILATHPPQQERAAVPDGWVLVPRRPNIDMLRAGGDNVSCLTRVGAAACYTAMVAAAPSVSQETRNDSAAPVSGHGAALPATPEPVAWLYEETGFLPGDGDRQLHWESNPHASFRWKQTPLYAVLSKFWENTNG